MKLYLKYDLNIALQVIVLEELNKLKEEYRILSHNEIEIKKPIVDDKYRELETGLRKYGIEIIDSTQNILIQKIKDTIVEMVFADDFPTLKTSLYLANKLNYDYNYISKIFSEATFFSIQQFIILQKIERVKQLMIENKLRLTEIAYMLNYSSVAHLSAQFKKTTGLTPSVFQRIINKRKIAEVPFSHQLNNTAAQTGTNTLHILLADDDADDRLFFTEAIEEVKIKTLLTIVKDGVQLMDYLNKPNTTLPNVVFLDLNMPRKGGIECLTEIRSSSKLKHISIAIYSTSSSEKDIEETFIKGANIYINKPDDLNELKRILIEVININWQYHKSGLNRDSFLINK